MVQRLNSHILGRRAIVRKYYNLPPLTTLAVFEAAARHANFKNAADEMNVTVSAVSRQIKALEDELELKLFVRHKNGVQLTAPAQDLFSEVAASLSRCSEAVQALRIEKDEEIVTFACTDAFATHWLMPKMEDFWAKFPHITVNHYISDEVRDFRNAEQAYGRTKAPSHYSKISFILFVAQHLHKSTALQSPRT